MSARRWTLIVVPHGSKSSRSIEVSRKLLRVVAALSVTVTVGVLSLLYVTTTKWVDISELNRLEKTNQLLAHELDRTRESLDLISDTLETMVERDRQVRLLAGLEPTDREVVRAGIGGPRIAPAPEERFLAADQLGQEALEMKFDVSGLLRRANLLAGSFRDAVDTVETMVTRLQHTPSLEPIQPGEGWFTSPFTSRRVHPIHGEARPHEGIDISAPLGTPILAPAKGIVVDVGNRQGYGKTVTISHGFGVVTKYAHCSKILVRVGQRVDRNQEIALVGNTGLATAPHVHYEVLLNGKPQNPRDFILPADRVVD